jgi:hypothetical protein
MFDLRPFALKHVECGGYRYIFKEPVIFNVGEKEGEFLYSSIPVAGLYCLCKSKEELVKSVVSNFGRIVSSYYGLEEEELNQYNIDAFTYVKSIVLDVVDLSVGEEVIKTA